MGKRSRSRKHYDPIEMHHEWADHMYNRGYWINRISLPLYVDWQIISQNRLLYLGALFSFLLLILIYTGWAFLQPALGEQQINLDSVHWTFYVVWFCWLFGVVGVAALLVREMMAVRRRIQDPRRVKPKLRRKRL